MGSQRAPRGPVFSGVKLRVSARRGPLSALPACVARLCPPRRPKRVVITTYIKIEVSPGSMLLLSHPGAFVPAVCEPVHAAPP